MRRRRGWTLVELLAVLFCGTALVAAGVSLAHVMLDLQSASLAHWRHRASLAQLAQQFRDDVHAAAAPAGTPAAGVWEWSVDDGASVRWAVEGGRLVRTALAQGRTVGQQAFPLPDDAVAALEFASDPAGPVASLVIRPATAAGGKTAGPAAGDAAAARAPKSLVPEPPVRIDAAWALDRRLARAAVGGR